MNRVYLLVYFVTLQKLYAHNTEVNLRQGTIVGTLHRTVFDRRLYYAFYGVPYAEAPLGKLRFKDPKPVKASSKRYNAGTGHRVTCAQTHIAYKKKYGVENCLVLNIYTPELKELKPVVVWYHGYGFTSSFSHIYSGDFFVDQDVVFVSVTYRLGVFGFLKVNDSGTDANMGLKDMVMSLKWIKKNINNFGGDNSKVTVMGSGSAGSYLSLLLLTKARRLFSKMILHSGSIFSPSMFQGNSIKEAKVIKDMETKLGKKLEKIAANDIVVASQKIYTTTDILNIQRPLVPFTTIIERKTNSSILRVRPDAQLKKYGYIKSDIPIMIGFNTQESISEVIPFIINPYYLLSFKSSFKFMVPFSDGCKYDINSTAYKKVANEIKEFYFKEGISEKSAREFVKYTSDLQKYPIYKFIKSLVAENSKVYVFKFNYKGSFNAMKANSMASAKLKLGGTASGDELCYLLRCEPYLERYEKGNVTRDKVFIKDISKMWSNFAKFAEPTPSGHTHTVTWPPMSTDGKVLLINGQNEVINTEVEEKMYKFWNYLYDKYYAEANCPHQVKDEL